MTTGERKIECLECGGEGHHDSGGVTPWGAWVSVPCGRCHGRGSVLVVNLTDAEKEFIATSPVCLAAPDLLAAARDAVDHINPDEHFAIQKALRDAIEKAEGR